MPPENRHSGPQEPLRLGLSLDNRPFVISNIQWRTTQGGATYLACTLFDQSSHVTGRYWDVPAGGDQQFADGDIVLVSGQVIEYNGGMQVKITSLRSAAADEYDPVDFLSPPVRPLDTMIDELRQIITQVGTVSLRELLEKTLLRPAFLREYSRAPAARSNHHARVGGLLEHSLSVAGLANEACKRYPELDRDLLVTAALLHDMGKVWEYELRPGFPTSTPGHLLGHIAMALLQVDAESRKINGFDNDLRNRLLHCILSHHGELEKGSPVTPKTLEAIVLHRLDMIDAGAQGYLDHVSGDHAPGDWTARAWMFENSPLMRPRGDLALDKAISD